MSDTARPEMGPEGAEEYPGKKIFFLIPVSIGRNAVHYVLHPDELAKLSGLPQHLLPRNLRTILCAHFDAAPQ